MDWALPAVRVCGLVSCLRRNGEVPNVDRKKSWGWHRGGDGFVPDVDHASRYVHFQILFSTAPVLNTSLLYDESSLWGVAVAEVVRKLQSERSRHCNQWKWMKFALTFDVVIRRGFGKWLRQWVHPLLPHFWYCLKPLFNKGREIM